MADQPINPSDADRPDVPDDVQALILRYHDNDLDAAGLSQLRDAMKQSESARALFVRWAMHSQLLSESLSANYHEEGEDPWQGSPTILAELAQLEEQAQATLVEIHHFDKPWYASRWTAGLGSIAAILALAIILIVTLTGSDAPPTQPDFTNNTVEPNKPAESAQPIPRDHPGTTPGSTPVATLTATHNATLARPASAGPEHPPTTGSHLHPGTRLTLTQGFAEITTVSGAVAIIEAPATLELINKNAIRLHTGKLVGICETESSKGFLVRTPHMDITDLGTRFGVDVSDHKLTEVHVFNGEVEVALSHERSVTTTVRRLEAGQAVASTTDGTSLRDVAIQAARFVQTMERPSTAADYVLAYWRFEDGTSGQPVVHTDGHSDLTKIASSDSSPNANHLFAFTVDSAPMFSDQVPAGTIPQTGEPNRGALNDSQPQTKRIRNLYTRGGEAGFAGDAAIENADLSQWTVEASVKPASLEGRQSYVSLVCRGEQFNLMLGLDNGRFFIERTDNRGGTTRVQSPREAELGQWTHLAATCDGTTLKLYGRGDDQDTFELLGQSAVAGPMMDSRGKPSLEWNIGGAPTLFDAQAMFDEVRISNRALDPESFLFSDPRAISP